MRHTKLKAALIIPATILLFASLVTAQSPKNIPDVINVCSLTNLAHEKEHCNPLGFGGMDHLSIGDAAGPREAF